MDTTGDWPGSSAASSAAQQTRGEGASDVPDVDMDKEKGNEAGGEGTGEGAGGAGSSTQLTFAESIFYSDAKLGVLSHSQQAKSLDIRVSSADLAALQAQLEALLWQVFDMEMEKSGAHDWLTIEIQEPSTTKTTYICIFNIQKSQTLLHCTDILVIIV